MASRSNETVVGVFHDRAQAQQAVNELKRLGFDETQVGVVGPGSDNDNMIPTDAGLDSGDNTYASEGAISGLATGAGVGALWGLGILAGVLPAIGPAIAGGTLAAILSSTAAGAAAAGLGGALIGLGFSKEEAEYYNSELEAGRTVVTVSAGSRRSEAESVLRNFGSYDITRKDDNAYTGSSMAESTTPDSMRTNSSFGDVSSGSTLGKGSIGRGSVGAGSTSAGSTRAGSMGIDLDADVDPDLAGASMGGASMKDGLSSTNRFDNAQRSDHEGRITAFDEELHIDKKPVETGSVNVHKEVHTEHKTIDVPVQREEVVIERRPASGHAGDIGAGQQEIHIPIREEQVKVDKQMVAKEEVAVSKRTVQDTEHVDETLRKEQIKVDRDANAKVEDRRGTNH